MIDIPNRTQNVIFYCICMRNASVAAVGPTTWFIGSSVLTTTADENGNPYYRNNIPSPLIIPFFTATHAGTYGCGSGFVSMPSVTIDLAISCMCNFNSLL